LEALVDLGYLSKPDPADYVYVPTSRLSALQELHDQGSGLALGSGFFLHWRQSTGEVIQRSLRGAEARAVLYEANQTRANSMGYTLIEEGVLVANLILLDRGINEVVELDAAVASLAEGSDDEFKILTSVDRNRQLSAFKIRNR
jgi:hypothetical protein